MSDCQRWTLFFGGYSLVAIVGGALIILLKDDLLDLFEWTERQHDARPFATFVLYVIAISAWTVILLPKAFVLAVCGYIFGIPIGFAAAMASGYLTMAVTLLIVRRMPACARRVGSKAVDDPQSDVRTRARGWLLKRYPEILVLNREMKRGSRFHRALHVWMAMVVPLPGWVKNYGVALLESEASLWALVYPFSAGIYSLAGVIAGHTSKNLVELSDWEEDIASNLASLVVMIIICGVMQHCVKKRVRRLTEEQAAEDRAAGIELA
jgi:hypothetical protein